MTPKLYKIICCILLATNIVNAQQTPGKTQSSPISIVGATAHIGNGNVIENSMVIFENGKITAVGKKTDFTAKGSIIHADGEHLYPGFILPNSTLGLGEVDAVRASNDFDEIGTFLPHIRSIIAYNAESKIIETCRINGVLLAQVTPRGGTISGTSSIVQLDAWNWEDAVIEYDDGIHLNWPKSYKRKYLSFGRGKYSEINKDYQKQINSIKNHFNQAKQYNPDLNLSENLILSASQRLFNSKTKLYIHVNLEKEIIDALHFADEFKLNNIVLVGAAEAYKTTEIIKTKNIPVILQRVHHLPYTEDEDYDLPYTLAVKLTKAGITVALENSGDMERMNSRNLPFYAGTLTGNGLDFEQALQLITLNAAQILGIDQQYGSIEKGKSATLFLSKGNALDMKTNNVTKAFIDGRAIVLKSHQTELYERYKSKLSQ